MGETDRRLAMPVQQLAIEIELRGSMIVYTLVVLVVLVLCVNK